MTNSENRVGKKPVPDDVLQYMNPEQLLTYRGMQGFGWYLKFVRRPLFQRLVFVMAHPDNLGHAVIEENGLFNKEHNIKIRDVETQVGQEPAFSPTYEPAYSS